VLRANKELTISVFDCMLRMWMDLEGFLEGEVESTWVTWTAL
jgi:hypothetical protein